ncbi:MAG: hypothetical protein WCA35_05175 [Kovacikia sp.]
MKPKLEFVAHLNERSLDLGSAAIVLQSAPSNLRIAFSIQETRNFDL